jgi:hypothetical protein
MTLISGAILKSLESILFRETGRERERERDKDSDSETRNSSPNSNSIFA